MLLLLEKDSLNFQQINQFGSLSLDCMRVADVLAGGWQILVDDGLEDSGLVVVGEVARIQEFIVRDLGDSFGIPCKFSINIEFLCY